MARERVEGHVAGEGEGEGGGGCEDYATNEERASKKTLGCVSNGGG